MATANLEERTQQLLAETLPEEQGLDAKVRRLIKSETMRRLTHYRRIDYALSRKYGMPFDEFIDGRVTRQHGYSWEVERDAMEWETAVGGILTMERKLRELRDLDYAITG